VTSLQVDPLNPQRIIVTLGGNWASDHVWMTVDGGTTWTNLTGNLAVSYWVNTLAVDWRFTTPVLYVGTARGIFRSLDSGATWSRFGDGMPNTTVTDLQFLPQFNLLAAATYGRGALEILVEPPPPGGGGGSGAGGSGLPAPDHSPGWSVRFDVTAVINSKPVPPVAGTDAGNQPRAAAVDALFAHNNASSVADWPPEGGAALMPRPRPRGRREEGFDLLGTLWTD
jgi:hypothetical protein